MKKIVLICAALLLLMSACSVGNVPEAEPTEYTHIDFVSEITQEDCYLCGNGSDPIVNAYWGEDNVGIVNLNTFELLRIEINRYDDHGQLIEEVAGYMQMGGMHGDDTHVNAATFPDNGYAHVQITGVRYSIDRDSIQTHLCQTCLDTINDMWFSGNPPAEYAIVSFAERTIQPLVECYPWFSAGDYGVDCEFKDDGAIDLLIHYCPSRYSLDENSESQGVETN